MRISFRQGIISHQSGGFLSITSGNVNIEASNKPVVVSIAHKSTNYTFVESTSVTSAWPGPFTNGTRYWLYWDFNPITFARTFGTTTLEPVIQSVEPGNGDVNISSVVPGDPGLGAFVVAQYYVLPTGRPITIYGSTGNDGSYTVTSTSYSTITGKTTIYVSEEVPDATGDGKVTLDSDSYGNPLKQVGRHWYNTSTNTHYVWSGAAWSEVIRIFAARLYNNSFSPMSITMSSYTGTQIGNSSSVRSGRILSYEIGKPIIRDDGTFVTSEDQIFANGSQVNAVRLESNVAFVQFPYELAVAAFTVVAWKASGKAQTAQYDDVATTVLGILTEDVLSEELGAVIIQGVVVNPDWSWTDEEIGNPLWVNNGLLVSADPHVTDALTYPYGRVPIARVLSSDSIIFEQGLGGKGEKGPPGSLTNIPPATTTTLGACTLTVDSSVPELAIVVSDLDPRLSDARNPLPHTHDASVITFTPVGNINASYVSTALAELDNEKLALAGGTMTGNLILNGDPATDLQAATKGYVDNRPMPYDISFFVAGKAAIEPSRTVGFYIAPRAVTITGNVTNLYGYALTPSSGSAVTFTVVKNGNTGSPVGTITFNNGAYVPNSNIVTASTFSLAAGDRLEVISPASGESNMANVSITIIGCAIADSCPS